MPESWYTSWERTGFFPPASTLPWTSSPDFRPELYSRFLLPSALVVFLWKDIEDTVRVQAINDEVGSHTSTDASAPTDPAPAPPVRMQPHYTLIVTPDYFFLALIAPLLSGASLLVAKRQARDLGLAIQQALRRRPAPHTLVPGKPAGLTSAQRASLRDLVASLLEPPVPPLDDFYGITLDPSLLATERHGAGPPPDTSARRDMRTGGASLFERAYFHIPSPAPYAAVQQAVALNTFERSTHTRFPRATLRKGDARGFAELRPITPEEELLMSPEEVDALAQRMWAHREELSDRDADTLDAISAVWISQAKNPTDRAPIFIDDLLRARGLAPKKSGSGRRGGYEPEQRADLWRCLLHLQDLWIDLAEATVIEHDHRGRRTRRTRTLQSRAFVMTDRIGQRRLDGSMDVEAILVTPGEAFGRFLLGPGRQVALLSSAALRYDPYRQKYEKRLARFLSWQWRVGAHKSDFLRTYRVVTLLEEIGLTPNTSRPHLTRSVLERALHRLLDDKLIAGWQYHDGWSDATLPRQGWLPAWLEARTLIEAPEIIKDAYRRLDLGDMEAPPAALPATPPSWSEQLRSERSRRGISQLVAAEEIGLSRVYLAQIERGRAPSAAAAEKIRRWLSTSR